MSKVKLVTSASTRCRQQDAFGTGIMQYQRFSAPALAPAAAMHGNSTMQQDHCTVEVACISVTMQQYQLAVAAAAILYHMSVAVDGSFSNSKRTYASTAC